MNSKIIKVGFCVSYDYEMLKKSIPRIYKDADIICLAVDKNRKSWAGNKFDFDNEAFFSFIKEIDVDHKIDVYEEDFAIPTLNSRENCNRHRMLIAERMGKGGWHIQIDSDEYFFDFKGFTEYLKKIHPNPTGNEKGMNVNLSWIPLVKRTKNGFLFVDFGKKLPEDQPFATNRPNYERARTNGYYCNLSPFYVLHETWARSDNDLLFKINNWGHSAEELSQKEVRMSYYNFWKILDEHNYQYAHNFHPALGRNWPLLGYIAADSIEDVFIKMPQPKFPMNAFVLKLYNSKIGAKLRQILGDPFR